MHDALASTQAVGCGSTPNRRTTHFRLPILVAGLADVHRGLTELDFEKPMASGCRLEA